MSRILIGQSVIFMNEDEIRNRLHTIFTMLGRNFVFFKRSSCDAVDIRLIITTIIMHDSY